MHIFVLLITILFATAILIICVDSNRFHTIRYEIKTNKLRENFHFVFISDLHNKTYGKHNQKLISSIHELNPDVILIGGDLLTAKPGKNTDTAIKLLLELNKNYPIYYANGNHEQRLDLYPEKYNYIGKKYEEELQQLKIYRLRNESIRIFNNIDIVGCEINKQFYKRLQKVPMKKSYITELLPERDINAFTILLAHNPVYFNNYVSYGADLVLSGHVHGGIARLPFLGGIISTDFSLFPKYDGGYFRKKNTDMIISRGLGAHTIPFRFLNPGELIDICLVSENRPI